jgi:hypothetical protein
MALWSFCLATGAFDRETGACNLAADEKSHLTVGLSVVES